MRRLKEEGKLRTCDEAKTGHRQAYLSRLKYMFKITSELSLEISFALTRLSGSLRDECCEPEKNVCAEMKEIDRLETHKQGLDKFYR